MVGVGEQGGWAQPCHPPVLPQIYFPRGVTPQSSHGWGGHPSRDLVPSTSCSRNLGDAMNNSAFI